MTPGSAHILRGDARSLPLPDASVDLLLTSPPYYNQRSYIDGGKHYAGQIGDEPDPGEYLNNLIACTAEWVRVLKPGGSIFVNLADKYSDRSDAGPSSTRSARGDHADTLPPGRSTTNTAPRKSLLGLPWRYALRCVDDLGLTLRRDLIWHKTTALPESVGDRCATRHEYLFHFTTQERYYSAIDLIREPSRPDHHRHVAPKTWHANGQPPVLTDRIQRHPLGRLPGSVWDIAAEPLTVPEHLDTEHYAAYPIELVRRIILGWSPAGICTRCGEGRQPTVDHGPPRGDFVAGDRTKLAGRTANSAERNRIYRERVAAGIGPRLIGHTCACTPFTDHPGTGQRHPSSAGPKGNHRPDSDGPAARPSDLGLVHRVGPTRECHLDAWEPAPTRPAVVLDPFSGTGTTILVAKALDRVGIGVDRSGDYCRLATWRTTDPGQLAKAMRVPAPPPQTSGQLDLFTAAGTT